MYMQNTPQRHERLPGGRTPSTIAKVPPGKWRGPPNKYGVVATEEFELGQLLDNAPQSRRLPPNEVDEGFLRLIYNKYPKTSWNNLRRVKAMRNQVSKKPIPPAKPDNYYRNKAVKLLPVPKPIKFPNTPNNQINSVRKNNKNTAKKNNKNTDIPSDTKWMRYQELLDTVYKRMINLNEKPPKINHSSPYPPNTPLPSAPSKAAPEQPRIYPSPPSNRNLFRHLALLNFKSLKAATTFTASNFNEVYGKAARSKIADLLSIPHNSKWNVLQSKAQEYISEHRKKHSILPLQQRLALLQKTLLKQNLIKAGKNRFNDRNTSPKTNKLYQTIFGSNLCGWSRSRHYLERTRAVMPHAELHHIVIDRNGNTTYSFLNYYAFLLNARRRENKHYMVTFISDECHEHMSLLFHAFRETIDRVYYFNTGFRDSELSKWLENRVIGLPMVHMDMRNVQDDCGAGRDKFCTLHSALMASVLYDYFEQRRKFPQARAKPVDAFKKAYIDQYLNSMYSNNNGAHISRTEPVLLEFLQRLRRAEVRAVNRMPKVWAGKHSSEPLTNNLRRSYFKHAGLHTNRNYMDPFKLVDPILKTLTPSNFERASTAQPKSLKLESRHYGKYEFLIPSDESVRHELLTRLNIVCTDYINFKLAIANSRADRVSPCFKVERVFTSPCTTTCGGLTPDVPPANQSAASEVNMATHLRMQRLSHSLLKSGYVTSTYKRLEKALRKLGVQITDDISLTPSQISMLIQNSVLLPLVGYGGGGGGSGGGYVKSHHSQVKASPALTTIPEESHHSQVQASPVPTFIPERPASTVIIGSAVSKRSTAKST